MKRWWNITLWEGKWMKHMIKQEYNLKCHTEEARHPEWKIGKGKRLKGETEDDNLKEERRRDSQNPLMERQKAWHKKITIEPKRVKVESVPQRPWNSAFQLLHEERQRE